MDPIEEVYRSEHDRLWRSLLAFTGDPEVAAEAEAETFSQAVGRGDALRNPRGWIWRTAFKVAAGLLADVRQRSGTGLDELAASADLPGGAVALDAPLLDFLDLLDTLSAQQRAVVVLRYAGGFKPSEIAGLLDTSPGTIRVQLHRAHAHLRERIDGP